MTPEEKRAMVRQMLMAGGQVPHDTSPEIVFAPGSAPQSLDQMAPDIMKPQFRQGLGQMVHPTIVDASGGALSPNAAAALDATRRHGPLPGLESIPYIDPNDQNTWPSPEITMDPGPAGLTGDDLSPQAPATSPRPAPAPSPFRRNLMMDTAEDAAESAYWQKQDPEQWALYEIEDAGGPFYEMLRDMPQETYREILDKVASGIPVPEAFGPAGFTARR